MKLLPRYFNLALFVLQFFLIVTEHSAKGFRMKAAKNTDLIYHCIRRYMLNLSMVLRCFKVSLLLLLLVHCGLWMSC